MDDWTIFRSSLVYELCSIIQSMVSFSIWFNLSDIAALIDEESSDVTYVNLFALIAALCFLEFIPTWADPSANNIVGIFFIIEGVMYILVPLIVTSTWLGVIIVYFFFFTTGSTVASAYVLNPLFLRKIHRHNPQGSTRWLVSANIFQAIGILFSLISEFGVDLASLFSILGSIIIVVGLLLIIDNNNVTKILLDVDKESFSGAPITSNMQVDAIMNNDEEGNDNYDHVADDYSVGDTSANSGIGNLMRHIDAMGTDVVPADSALRMVTDERLHTLVEYQDATNETDNSSNTTPMNIVDFGCYAWCLRDRKLSVAYGSTRSSDDLSRNALMSSRLSGSDLLKCDNMWYVYRVEYVLATGLFFTMGTISSFLQLLSEYLDETSGLSVSDYDMMLGLFIGPFILGKVLSPIVQAYTTDLNALWSIVLTIHVVALFSFVPYTMSYYISDNVKASFITSIVLFGLTIGASLGLVIDFNNRLTDESNRSSSIINYAIMLGTTIHATITGLIWDSLGAQVLPWTLYLSLLIAVLCFVAAPYYSYKKYILDAVADGRLTQTRRPNSEWAPLMAGRNNLLGG